MINMEESKKIKIQQIEIIAAVVLLLVSVVSFFPKAGITGFVSVETKKQLVDLTIANSQSYILTTNQEKPFYLTTLKLSGEIIGNGTVKAYIRNSQGQKILVYSNIIKKGSGLNAVTGMSRITGNVVGTNTQTEGNYLLIEHLENIEGEKSNIAKDETLASGLFENQCLDSCFIEMLLNKDNAYQLLFYVDDGTILKVKELVYAIKKD